MIRYLTKILENIGDWFSHRITQKAFLYSVYVSYILFAIIFLGVATIDPTYLQLLDTIMKTYVALFLVLRFNPLVSERHTKIDRQIAFSAGVFLLVSTSVGLLAKSYFMSLVSSSSDDVLKIVSV